MLIAEEQLAQKGSWRRGRRIRRPKPRQAASDFTTVMSTPDYAPYIQGWKQRLAARKEILRRQAAEARAVADRAAELLVERYGARRVILFGSLARSELREGSDIDLAVEGLAKSAYLEALVEVSRLTDTPVELVLLEECHGFFRQRILSEGIALRDAEKTPHACGGDR